MSAAADPAVGLRFDVTVDGVDIGSFTACEGLAAEYEMFEYLEGGQNDFVHRVPGRLKYTPVKLTRPLDARSDAAGGGLASWFSKQRAGVTRQTAAITAIDGRGQKIARWNLVDVYPMRWTGPSLSIDGNSVPKETLELAHNGFMA
jgi:phage tail-like protein